MPLADDRTVETVVPDETRRHIDAGKKEIWKHDLFIYIQSFAEKRDCFAKH